MSIHMHTGKSAARPSVNPPGNGDGHAWMLYLASGDGVMNLKKWRMALSPLGTELSVRQTAPALMRLLVAWPQLSSTYLSRNPTNSHYTFAQLVSAGTTKNGPCLPFNGSCFCCCKQCRV